VRGLQGWGRKNQRPCFPTKARSPTKGLETKRNPKPPFRQPHFPGLVNPGKKLPGAIWTRRNVYRGGGSLRESGGKNGNKDDQPRTEKRPFQAACRVSLSRSPGMESGQGYLWECHRGRVPGQKDDKPGRGRGPQRVGVRESMLVKSSRAKKCPFSREPGVKINRKVYPEPRGARTGRSGSRSEGFGLWTSGFLGVREL